MKCGNRVDDGFLPAAWKLGGPEAGIEDGEEFDRWPWENLQNRVVDSVLQKNKTPGEVADHR